MDIGSNDVRKLQVNLGTIRKIAGWTAQDLGEKIGVTKQTISNLENQKTEMSLTQYIAIRTVLDYEIENNKANAVLPQVVHILLDVPDDKISAEEHQRVNQATSTLAAASVGGIGLAGLISASVGLLGGITAFAAAGTSIGTASWLQRLMKGRK